MATEFGQNDIEVISSILSTLKNFDPEEREKILQTIDTYFDRKPRSSNSSSKLQMQEEPEYPISNSSFSEDRAMSCKAFILQKQPQTDVERVACLAYYLTHYLDIPYFKTIDLSKLNTEAAQPKFSNAAFAVDNATKLGYLTQAPTKGNKQLSAAGEHFVLALPDREAARAAMKTVRPRRKVKKQNNKRIEGSIIAA